MDRGDILEWVLEIVFKHRGSWELALDILRFANKILQKKMLPETKYLFFKNMHSEITPMFHLYCKGCNKITHKILVEKRPEKNHSNNFTCESCNFVNKIGKCKVGFVTFPVEHMLKDILNKYESELIFPSPNSSQFPISDIWDGCHHQKIMQKEGKFISIILNTDGVQVFNSTSNALWPLMIIVNNLPKESRFKLQNVVCIGFFYGKAIEMQIFLETFIKNLKAINERGGIQTKLGKFKIFCTGTSLDSAAKPKVMNIKQYNGYSSCPYCEIEGIRVDGSVKFPFR